VFSHNEIFLWSVFLLYTGVVLARCRS